jgi:hypothetical protein
MFQMNSAAIPGWDLDGPTFANVRVLPDTNYAGPYKVWSDITDGLSHGIGAESLFYRVNLGTWTPVKADSSSGDRYCFTIPSVTMPATVDYYFWAKDTFSTNHNIDFWTTWPVCSPESTMLRFMATNVGVSGGNRLQPGDSRFDVTPNPFRTSVRFTLARYGAERATVRIYSTAGTLVRTLPLGPEDSGMLSSVWDGRDEQGSPVPSGAYVYQVQAGEYSQGGKLLLNR